jgi:hypothetical protein
MNDAWKTGLHTDPLPILLDWDNPALTYFVMRDLMGQAISPVEVLWEMQESKRLVAKQQVDGSWRYPGKSHDPISNTNYNLLETYRTLRILVEIFGFQREHPALAAAAEYVFSFQSEEGDIRGILGNQYMPYYHGAILELLIKGGYAQDTRTIKGLDWLLSMRQTDGGWLIPAQLIPASQKTNQLWHAAPVQPDRSRPHSHIATGMVLRAFAAHPDYCCMPEMHIAGERLKERFFQADKYYDRKAPSYWLKFQFPFWWPNLLTALDSLSRLGFDRQDKDINRGLDWFLQNQDAEGLWGTGYGSGRKAEDTRRWVGLAICRVLQRFFS